MKILKMTNIAPEAIHIDLDDTQWVKMWKFGHMVYTSTSDKIKKSALVNIKKDVILCDWNAEKLTQLYIDNR